MAGAGAVCTGNDSGALKLDSSRQCVLVWVPGAAWIQTGCCTVVVGWSVGVVAVGIGAHVHS